MTPEILTLKQAAAEAGVTTERIRELAWPRPTHPLAKYLDGVPLVSHGRGRIDAEDLRARVVPNVNRAAAGKSATKSAAAFAREARRRGRPVAEGVAAEGPDAG